MSLKKEGNRDGTCNVSGIGEEFIAMQLDIRDPFGNKHSKGIKCIQRHRYNRGIDNGF